MINRYFNPTVFKGEFYTPPVDMLASVMKEAQAQYDKNYLIADELRNKEIKALDPDRARANEIQQQTNAQIDALVKQYNGDYSKANAGLRDLLSNVRAQYRPGGEVDAIQGNYNSYNTWLANEQKRLNDGKITADDFNIARHNTLSGYKGIGQKSEAGVYAQLNPSALPEYADGTKPVLEILNGLKPKKKSITESRKDASGNWFNTSREVEAIDENEAAQAVSTALLSDVKWREYAIGKAQMLGVDPQQYIESEIDNYIKTYVPLRAGVLNDTRKNEYKGFDELTKLRMQQSHDRSMVKAREESAKRVAKYKNDLENPEAAGGQERPQELIGLNKAAVQFQPITPQSDMSAGKKSSFGIGDIMGILASPGASAANVSRNAGSIPSSISNYANPSTAYPSVAKTMEKGNPKVNMPLFVSVASSMKGKSDREVWEAYNAGLARTNNYAAGIYMKPYVQPAQQKSAADQLIPRVISSGATVYEIDANGGLIQKSGNEAQEILTKMYDYEKRQAKALVVGISSSYSGNAPAGHVVQGSDNKKYIIADNSTTMKRYNHADYGGKSVRDKAFGHLQTGQSYSDVFEIPNDEGRMVPTMGVSKYGPNGPSVEYYSAINDPITGQFVPNLTDPWYKQGPGGTKQFYNEADIEQRILGNQLEFMTHRQKAPSKADTEYVFDGYQIN